MTTTHVRKDRRWRRILLAYIALLALSHLWRAMNPAEFEPLPSQQFATLKPVRGEKALSGGEVRMAYQDLAPAGEAGPGAPVVVLLNGSPGNAAWIAPLAEQLRRDFRVIVPELPGFGASDRNVPDYSFRAHAVYVRQLLNRLGVERAHFVGYSMGGGVALSMADQRPSRVQSISLISGIGVQELRLLGDYTLNHSLHAVMLLGVWMLQEVTPHFGYFDTWPLDHGFARNFFDSDRRPLRRILLEYEDPMLLIHARRDRLVPPATARETLRIVPQAEDVWVDGGHIGLISSPERYIKELRAFINKADRGEATVRAEAPVARIAAAAEPFALGHRFEGWSLVFVILLLVIAIQFSADLTCIGAGLLVSKGVLGFFPATLGCFVGAVLGDTFLYYCGAILGRPILSRRPFRWFISPDRALKNPEVLRRRSFPLIFSARFLPGMRITVYLAAGIFRLPISRFIACEVVATSVWAPSLVGVSAIFGASMLGFFQRYEEWALLGVILFVLGMYLIVYKGLPLFTWRGRRLFVSGWRRRARWEFWPRTVFYPPIVLYILWLCLKYRSLTLFTATNPVMGTSSGFVEERKSDVYKGFAPSCPALPKWTLIKAEQRPSGRKADLRRFMDDSGLGFPMVLKPDIGLRGQGVRIVRDAAAAEGYLEQAEEDTVAQEYVPGVELGIFYYRYPEDEAGRIFAITDKRMTSVTGDGRRTLEELILTDRRAMYQAPLFLRRFDQRREEIPAEGEVIPLTELGTHALGALFLEGIAHKTPELEAAVDEISKACPGFYFGRYDMRAPSMRDFEAGRNLKIIELNGVTSEATSIYDPNHSLWHAYRTLARQWRICFEIADRNRARGQRPMGVFRLLNLLSEFLERGS